MILWSLARQQRNKLVTKGTPRLYLVHLEPLLKTLGRVTVWVRQASKVQAWAYSARWPANREVKNSEHYAESFLYEVRQQGRLRAGAMHRDVITITYFSKPSHAFFLARGRSDQITPWSGWG